MVYREFQIKETVAEKVILHDNAPHKLVQLFSHVFYELRVNQYPNRNLTLL